MKLYKPFKILLLIVLIYLIVSIVIYGSDMHNYVKTRFSEQTYDYVQVKFCHECVRGEKTGVCPKINRDPSLSGYVEGIDATYPNAKEYKGDLPRVYGGYPLEEKRKLKISEIDENLIIENDYCYYRSWTEDDDYLSGFVPKPSKSRLYFEILKDPEFYRSVLIGQFYWLVCSIRNCN